MDFQNTLNSIVELVPPTLANFRQSCLDHGFDEQSSLLFTQDFLTIVTQSIIAADENDEVENLPRFIRRTHDDIKTLLGDVIIITERFEESRKWLESRQRELLDEKSL